MHCDKEAKARINYMPLGKMHNLEYGPANCCGVPDAGLEGA